MQLIISTLRLGSSLRAVHIVRYVRAVAVASGCRVTGIRLLQLRVLVCRYFLTSFAGRSPGALLLRPLSRYAAPVCFLLWLVQHVGISRVLHIHCIATLGRRIAHFQFCGCRRVFSQHIFSMESFTICCNASWDT